MDVGGDNEMKRRASRRRAAIKPSAGSSVAMRRVKRIANPGPSIVSALCSVGVQRRFGT